jgi:hypothetical protein
MPVAYQLPIRSRRIRKTRQQVQEIQLTFLINMYTYTWSKLPVFSFPFNYQSRDDECENTANNNNNLELGDEQKIRNNCQTPPGNQSITIRLCFFHASPTVGANSRRRAVPRHLPRSPPGGPVVPLSTGRAESHPAGCSWFWWLPRFCSGEIEEIAPTLPRPLI